MRERERERERAREREGRTHAHTHTHTHPRSWTVLIILQVKVIDFGNAFEERDAVSYHDEFEVQSLRYRAPEVTLTKRDYKDEENRPQAQKRGREEGVRRKNIADSNTHTHSDTHRERERETHTHTHTHTLSLSVRV